MIENYIIYINLKNKYKKQKVGSKVINRNRKLKKN
jgi:hypothetical protein